MGIRWSSSVPMKIRLVCDKELRRSRHNGGRPKRGDYLPGLCSDPQNV